MSFEAIFVTLFVTGWLLCGAVPWVVLSAFTRGRAGLATLPLCAFTGLVAGLAVPLLGKDDAAGIWLSMAAAVAAPGALLAVRRFSFGPVPAAASEPPAVAEPVPTAVRPE
jgi:hypothetical protein